MERKKKKVTIDGRAIIWKNKKHIHEGEFRRNETLVYAQIPSNVCEIRSSAFQDCINLENIDIAGSSLEAIGRNAFAGCQKLRHMTLPDDVFVFCHAFQGCTGLQKPIFNRSGTTLYAYPSGWTNTQYRVPEGVNTIASTAFTENDALEEVILPDTVSKIEFKAFCGSNIKRITIPATVKEISEKTFYNCKQLETVIFLGDTKIAYNAFRGTPETLTLISAARLIQLHEKYWAIGSTFLCADASVPPEESHLADPVFLDLAQGCSDGNAASMWNLSQYFAELNKQKNQEFYSRASNFWSFFSYLAGSPDGTAWYSEWQLQNHGCRLPAVLDESRSGDGLNGSLLRCLGYLFFEKNVLYNLHPTANSGITLIHIYPHDDGTWESANYQSTYLDEYLNSLPVCTVYHHPSQKPDAANCAPSLFSIMGQAVSTSWERNGRKRMNNPFFLKFV